MKKQSLTDQLLDIPVGQVVTTIGKILDSKIDLKITEQRRISDSKFIRKVEISSNGVPLINAHVKFDSKNIPKFVMKEILGKKIGIGTILTQKNINAVRNTIKVDKDLETSKLIREYEILVEGVIWFVICEEIKLDGFGSSYY